MARASSHITRNSKMSEHQAYCVKEMNLVRMDTFPVPFGAEFHSMQRRRY